jgi:hypothetical protein
MVSKTAGPPADASPVLTPAEQRTLVHQLTHDVLADTAPEELPQFEASASQYLDNPGQKIQSKSDEMLGFGLEIIVPLTPYIVAAATQVVRFIAKVLSDAAEEELKPAAVRWVRQLFHREPAPAPAEPLPARLTEQIRDIAISVCRDLGADQGDAAVVADAIVGRLTTAPR